jgi:hypothetical protein
MNNSVMDNVNATAGAKQAESVHVFDPIALLKEGCSKAETGIEHVAKSVGASLKSVWNNAGNESKDLKSLFFTPLSEGTIGGALILGAGALGKAGIEANAAGAAASAAKEGATAAGGDANAAALAKAAAAGAATGAVEVTTSTAAGTGEIAAGAAAAIAAAGAGEAVKRAVEKAGAAAGKAHAQVDKPAQK